MQPVLLKSTDSAAPALTGQDGSAYDLFKWALPQLGWTIEYDDPANFKIAFRNNPLEGTGYYLQVIDKAADTTAGYSQFAVCYGYSSMSDVSTGSNQFPSSHELYFVKSYTSNGTERKWFIVGNDRFFHVGTATYSLEEYRMFFVGDFYSVKPSDTTAFVLGMGKQGSLTNHILHSAYSGMPPALYWSNPGLTDNEYDISEIKSGLAANHDSTSIGVNFYLARNATFNSEDIPGREGSKNPITNAIDVSKVYVKETFNNSAVRGVLPGLLTPLHALFSEFDGVVSPLDTTQIQISGQTVDCIYVPTSMCINDRNPKGALLIPTIEWETI